MKIDAMAFGAHPDDVELSCGGTLIKLADMGYTTGVTTLTKAEAGTRGSSEIRTSEFIRACEIMSVKVREQLDIPDANVEVTRANKLKVIRVLRQYRPGIIFVPYWEVRHPDHGYTSTLVKESAFLAGLKKIDTGQEPFRPNRILFYPSRYEFKPSFIIDISECHDRKIEAVMAYKSQFHNPEKSKYGKDETYISRPGFIDAIINRARQYGAYIGVNYGEPFLIREHLKMEDPVKHFGPDSQFSIP